MEKSKLAAIFIFIKINNQIKTANAIEPIFFQGVTSTKVTTGAASEPQEMFFCTHNDVTTEQTNKMLRWETYVSPLTVSERSLYFIIGFLVYISVQLFLDH